MSLIAKDFLIIQSTSVPSEQAFSVANNTITQTRNRLDPETAREILCLKSWIENKLGININTNEEINIDSNSDSDDSNSDNSNNYDSNYYDSDYYSDDSNSSYYSIDSNFSSESSES